MSKTKRSRRDADFKSSDYSDRPRSKKRSQSSENESSFSPVRKKYDYEGSNSRRKDNRKYEREGKSDRRERKRTRDEDESRSRKDTRYERNGSEEMEHYSRKSKDVKDSRRYESRDKYDSRSKYGSEKFDDYEKGDRYWGRGESNPRDRKSNSERYSNKYTTSDEIKTVGSRYYGDTEHNHKKYRPVDDKENLDDENAKTKNNSELATERERNNISSTNESGLVKESTGVATASQKRNTDMLTSRTGGAYIPPAKLRMMQAQITDKSSAAYQRLAWEALKKSIHGHINKVNTANIRIIVRELLKENIVRGRGLLCRSIIQAQAASPTFTHVYAALVSVINSKVLVD